MTTIAYRDGVMAADSHVGCNGVRSGTARKVFEHDGGAIAGSGSFGEVLRFKDWIVAGADEDARPELKESNLIWFRRDGSFIEYDPAGSLSFEAPFYAIGSGREIAIGAMAAGATAEEAVRIASDWDSETGGEIVTVEIGGER